MYLKLSALHGWCNHCADIKCAVEFDTVLGFLSLRWKSHKRKLGLVGKDFFFGPKLSSHMMIWLFLKKDSTSLTPLSEKYGKILNALYNRQRAEWEKKQETKHRIFSSCSATYFALVTGLRPFQLQIAAGCLLVCFIPTDLLSGSTTMARGCDMFPSRRVLRVWEALSSLATLIVFLYPSLVQ